MTDKELKKLSRSELLIILIKQGKEIEKLREELSAAQTALDDKNIRIEKAGSIAEAVFALNDVYESIDKAAKQFLENIQRRNEESKAECERLIAEAQEKADAIIAGAESDRNIEISDG